MEHCARGLGRARGASHRLSDVGLPPIRVLQGVALGVGQAPPAATGTGHSAVWLVLVPTRPAVARSWAVTTGRWARGAVLTHRRRP